MTEFTAWRDAERAQRFDEAVHAYLAQREPGQPEGVLRERVKLHAELEELLATSAMVTLRGTAARLQADGMTRAEMLDALVALTASFGLDDHDEERSTLLLHALSSTTAAGLRATFPHGPAPVIAAQLELARDRSRNQRRRKRR